MHNWLKGSAAAAYCATTTQICLFHRGALTPNTALTVEWSRKSRGEEEEPQKTHKSNATERGANCSKTLEEGRREKWEGGRGDNLAFV